MEIWNMKKIRSIVIAISIFSQSSIAFDFEAQANYRDCLISAYGILINECLSMFFCCENFSCDEDFCGDAQNDFDYTR
jgi:hypothetical protein